MRCSHGVPYEAKCTKCFAEAMARETLRRLMAPAQSGAVKERGCYYPSLSDPGDRNAVLAPTFALQ
jgi:hypothetical protein